MKFVNFFLFLWVFFVLLNPDPDPGTPLNPDPIRIWIRNTGSKGLWLELAKNRQSSVGKQHSKAYALFRYNTFC
jgi:hypothetical protein